MAEEFEFEGGPPTWTTAEFHQDARKNTFAGLMDGSESAHHLCSHVSFLTTKIPENVLRYGWDPKGDDTTEELKALWWYTITAAKHLDADDESGHWKIIAYVAGAKAMGTICMPSKDGGSIPIETHDGILYEDMPYFDKALREAWSQGPQSIGHPAWRNLNAFASKLNSTGAYDLVDFAIWTFRDALETNSPAGREGNDSSASVRDRLPAVHAWLLHSHFYFTRMIRNSEQPAEIQRFDNNIGDTMGLGKWSVSRFEAFKFWIQRLDTLKQNNKADSGGTDVEDVAALCYKMAESWDRTSSFWNNYLSNIYHPLTSSCHLLQFGQYPVQQV